MDEGPGIRETLKSVLEEIRAVREQQSRLEDQQEMDRTAVKGGSGQRVDPSVDPSVDP